MTYKILLRKEINRRKIKEDGIGRRLIIASTS
jgi:hypothetical protein